ncbi:MAG: hypothetical protein BRD50_02495, partial [Bacteroidetes bacterium SW_11_45_7]
MSNTDYNHLNKEENSNFQLNSYSMQRNSMTPYCPTVFSNWRIKRIRFLKTLLAPLLMAAGLFMCMPSANAQNCSSGCGDQGYDATHSMSCSWQTISVGTGEERDFNLDQNVYYRFSTCDGGGNRSFDIALTAYEEGGGCAFYSGDVRETCQNCTNVTPNSCDYNDMNLRWQAGSGGNNFNSSQLDLQVHEEGSCGWQNQPSSQLAYKVAEADNANAYPENASTCNNSYDFDKSNPTVHDGTSGWQVVSGPGNVNSNGTVSGLQQGQTTTVQWTVRNGCSSNSDNVDVTRYDYNNSPNSVSASNDPICSVGESTTLSINGGDLGNEGGEQYVWYTGGCGSGGSVGTGTSINVSPNNTTTYYVRAEGGCNTTGCASRTLNVNQPQGNPGNYGNNQWNAYVYDGNSSNFGNNTYNGFYTQGGLDFDSRNEWNGSGSPADASGYQGCDPGNNTHSVRYKREGFPCAEYSIDIPNHDDDVWLYVNGNQVFNHNGCCDSHNNVWSGVLDGSSTVELRWTEGSGGSHGGLNFDDITPNLNANASTQSDVTCNGGNDGSVSVSASGGVPGYSYNWSTGSNAQNPTGLSAGTYTVTVTDDCGNTDVANTTVNQPSSLTSSVNNTSDVTCHGDGDGSINIGVSGGNGGYNYSWSDGASGQDRSGLGPGNYSVTITDAPQTYYAEGFEYDFQDEWSTPNFYMNPINQSFNGSDAAGSWNNGEINADLAPSQLNGGKQIQSFEYYWYESTNETGYVIDLIDDNGNRVLRVGTENPQWFVTDAAGKDEIFSNCSGGCNYDRWIHYEFTFNWSNGTYDYRMEDTQTGTVRTGTRTLSNSTNIESFRFSGSPYGTGNHVIFDDIRVKENCTTTINNITINEPAPLSASVNSTSGGYSYNWSPSGSGQDPNGLSGGDYDVTITDSKGCQETINNITINEPPALSASVNNVTDVSCNGFSDGAIDINVSGGNGGYSYSWAPNGSGQDPGGLSAGDYDVTVEDQKGCRKTINNITVSEPAPLLASIENVTDVSCNGFSDGAIDISVSGGTNPYSYNWSNGSNNQDISNISAGSYSVTITDDNNCSTNINFITVGQPPELEASVASTTDASCNGFSDGSIDLDVTGGTQPYSYNWSNGSGAQDPGGLSQGSYSVTVTDDNNCVTYVQNITISEPAPLTTSASTSQYAGGWNVTCNGASDGSIDLSVSGGTSPYSYNWSNGASSQDISGLTAGTYSVTL